jgi:hypothetical protein
MARVRWEPAPYGSDGACAQVAGYEVQAYRESVGTWVAVVWRGGRAWRSTEYDERTARRAAVALAKALARARPPL